MITIPNANLLVSFVISTHNRRKVLLNTLASLYLCGLQQEAFEIIVVDNASKDGTAEAVEREFPHVLLLPQKRNRGSCAKNLALPHARGRYIVFLDDDSYPRYGSVARMIRHFVADPDLGAVVFEVHLPDGSAECSAYPDVFIGCGTGFRRQALAEVGGLPEDFFMQAEEYDLSLRLLDAGWTVKRFDDLHVVHLKASTARRPRRVMRLDVRNNLILTRRYFPQQWIKPFARDWMSRYYKIAAARKQRVSFFAGAIQGFVASSWPRKRTPISDAAFEAFAKIQEIKARLAVAQQLLDIKTVIFVDLGKNILPYWMAARELGIDIVAIADQKLGASSSKRARKYRGVPIVDDEESQTFAADAVLIANLSPVHAEERRREWRAIAHRPVIDLFELGQPWTEDLADEVPSVSFAISGAADPAASEFRQTVARSA
ncbi:MAG: glycosyltransferase [Anaerolineae bacterium]|nr:glycosyltransferase [Phycisphaerae bacterium]